ncbi:hypothetical protein B1R94_13725 [Mycolicibacterium litorale]|nr:hypothetical protein B1R94_13725 [Mycolicibacterium litorale]
MGASGGNDTPVSTDVFPRATLATRLRAKIFAGRLDQDIEAGIVPLPGSPLALHMARLTAVDEREALAHSLRQALADLDHGRPGFTPRIPAHPQRLAACRDVVDDITLLLHSPRPVRARGVARLRMLLSDGTGPLYSSGRGSLAADLRGVLAAL